MDLGRQLISTDFIENQRRNQTTKRSQESHGSFLDHKKVECPALQRGAFFATTLFIRLRGRFRASIGPFQVIFKQRKVQFLRVKHDTINDDEVSCV